jgi:HTH-type transcriptional regulator/antitoxin HigA
MAASDAKKRYLELVETFPLRPLRTDRELTRAIKVVDQLLDRGKLTAEEADYHDVLSDLIARYESKEHPMSPVPDAAMLGHLMEARGVGQTDVARATGIVNSTISEVLSGKRKLNRQQIGKLAKFFHVSPDVFAFEA